ncbi:hypothetical protein Bbelb_259280 [Branchiostoma belcheri]|nr:hypothetical protein Bbelb_259280 [Branchiostoma belcheri]
MLHVIRNTRTRKAAGPDNITGRLTKEFAYELSTPLTWILNASLAEGRVPREWRDATVVPLAKTSPPSITELRPVSLTSILAKVCESFVSEQILADIAPNIDDKQFGGLPGRSTTLCLVDIMHLLYKNSDHPGTHDLNELDKWTNESFMKLHPNKCKVVHFHFTKIPPPLPALQIDGHTLQSVNSAKLLGVWIQSDLKWNTHVTHMIKQGSKRLFLLRRLKQFSLPIDDMVVVYTTYIRPVLE